MKIITATDLEPNVKQYLLSLPEADLFYNDHGLKHPAALYNTSLHKIESDLADFLIVYESLSIENFNPAKQNENGEKLAEVMGRYRMFLYSLREHLDDCFHVVKTLIAPDARIRDDRNQFNWLKNNPTGDKVKNFLQSVSSYKAFLDKIVNELKHNNGVISWICFIDPEKQDFILGYYVANVRNDKYAPVEKIHAKFEGQDTAFSFGRDVRFNLFHLFLISEELVALIKQLRIVDPALPTVEPAESRRNLFEKVCRLPKYVFPDEQVKDIVSTELINGSLELEYPSSSGLPTRRHRMVVLSWNGDGITRTFGLLYRRENNSSNLLATP